ncbi:MAG: MFS transporter [Bryobacteraceae bacterium]
MRANTRAWLVVAALWVVALLNYLDRQVIFSMFPVVRSELHLSDIELGLIGSAFLWVYGLCSPFAGFVADRYGRRRVLIFSLVIWSAVTWATGLARNIEEMLVARALMGISEACYLPAALAMIADYHKEGTRSLATGLHFSGIYVGIVLGGVGGGWVAEHYGWRAAFTILGVAGVLYTPILLAVLREEKPVKAASAEAQPKFWAATRELVTLRGFGAVVTVFSILSIANWLVYTWMPLYLFERFHMNLAASGFSATFYLQAGSVAGILIGGTLADRWCAQTPRGRVWTQAVGLAGAAPFLFLVGFTGIPGVLIAGLAVFGVGRGMFDSNAMPVLCQIARPELRSTGYGLLNMAGTLTGGVVAIAGGALKSTLGLGGMIQIAGILLLVGCFLLWRLPVSDAPPVEG